MAAKSLDGEIELLGKIAGGDQHAFTILFNHYQRDVLAVSQRITRSRDLALEVVQDIFIKIWVGREKLTTIDNFGGYLNRVVRNQCYDVLKQLARESESNLNFQKTSSEYEETTEQQLDYNESLGILREALAELPPQQKLVYQLCHQDGLKYEEAARQLNISPETVRAHMKQALRKIREHFNKAGVLYPLLVIALVK